MASTSSVGRAKCKRNVGGKVCRCQEWLASEVDESFCDCCEHHMCFHELLRPIAGGYGRCVKECGDGESLYEDGCQTYIPRRHSKDMRCEGCGCHRNYHEKAIQGADESSVRLQHSSGDASTCLTQPSSKRIKRGGAAIPFGADSGQAGAAGRRMGRREEGWAGDLRSTSVGEGRRQGEDGVEDGTTAERRDLEPKHKVFLSFSGADRDFVEQLCIDVERRDRYPFFDKRRRCLPVGMEFPKLLFRAIRQCEVGVAVLSEEYFTRSKWPMLELVEMVRRVRGRGGSMSIVPVFLGITREECRRPETQERWAARWEDWAERDESINIEEWKEALKVFGSTTGLAWKGGEVQLRREVVDAVCELVLPETRWDDSNVEGKDRLCEVILHKAGLMVKDPGVVCRVVGVYGVGGVGKSTLCKVLCNRLFREFRGRVWHVELKSDSEVELLRGALRVLTDAGHDILEKMSVDQCKDHLKRRIVEGPVFLAVDNVDEESAEQAKEYLLAGRSVGMGSLVVVTARSEDQLRALNIREGACLEMPELEQLEARKIFRNYFASISGVGESLDKDIVDFCVERCRFSKGDGRSEYYHPLALKVLGSELGDRVARNLFDEKVWKSRLLEIEEPQRLLGTEAGVFDSEKLERLKRKSLLEEAGDGWRDVGIHNLWRKLCVAEAEAEKFAD